MKDRKCAKYQELVEDGTLTVRQQKQGAGGFAGCSLCNMLMTSWNIADDESQLISWCIIWLDLLCPCVYFIRLHWVFLVFWIINWTWRDDCEGPFYICAIMSYTDGHKDTKIYSLMPVLSYDKNRTHLRIVTANIYNNIIPEKIIL